MADADFATHILTSKSPEEVANFLSHSLEASSTLIEKNLSVWFSNYVNMISRYNHDLNSLVSNGRTFFQQAPGEFGSVEKIWNCLASSVMSQIQTNEALIKTIKADVLHAFYATFKEDYKYSELVVNSHELQEFSSQLDDTNGAYNWNVKAPAILSNFENYKRYEKLMLFNAFMSYLNTVNAKTSTLVNKSESAVNFILKEFQIDDEMAKYKDYMLETVAPPPSKPAAKDAKSKPAFKSSPVKSSRESISSGSSGPTSTKDKRKSRLRSKVGSILWKNKKKSGSMGHDDTIPENESVASTTSRSNTFTSHTDTRNSLYGAPSSAVPQQKARAGSVAFSAAQGRAPESPTKSPTKGTTPAAAFAPDAGAPGSSRPPAVHNFSYTSDAAPLQPSEPVREEPKPEPVPAPVSGAPEPAAPVSASAAPAADGANFVRYSSSDDESDVPLDKNGQRLSLLNAHDLEEPPKKDSESESRSRNTSSGKYSFEYGDESKSISTPLQTPTLDKGDRRGVFEEQIPEVKNDPAEPEPTPIPGSLPTIPPPVEAPVADPTPEYTPAPISSASAQHAARHAPPPPPSRKNHEVRRESGIHAPPRRDSYSQPQMFDGMSLVSQTTGNSMLSKDPFKHFSSTDGLSIEGLNTSVAEIINVTFANGQVQKSQVLGEIAFNYNSSQPLESFGIKIPTQFTKSLLNERLMTQQDHGVYALNVPQITGKTVGGIKYSIDQVSDRVPLLAKQIWKFEPHQASLIVKVSLNPAFSESITLENFVVSTALDSSVSSTSASSKPEGSFNKDLNRMTWRYTQPVVLNASSPEVKLIARIMTSGKGRESPSGLKIRFTATQGSSSYVKVLDLNDEPVPSIKSLSSGNYISHS